MHFTLHALLLLSLSADPPESAHVPAGLLNAATQAAAEQDDCRAALLYFEAHRRCIANSSCLERDRYLYKAAETMSAVDISNALRLYRMLISKYPGITEADYIKERIRDLSKIAKEESGGASCIPPAARCGDWITHKTEGCDDGNRLDGDGCDSQCNLEPCYEEDGMTRQECRRGLLVEPRESEPDLSEQAKESDRPETWSEPDERDAQRGRRRSSSDVSVRQVVLTTAAVGALGSSIAAGVGVLSWLNYAGARAELAALQNAAEDSGVVNKREASELYAKQVTAGEGWDVYGRRAFNFGLLGLGVCAGVVLVTSAALPEE